MADVCGEIALFDIDGTMAMYDEAMERDLAKLRSPEETAAYPLHGEEQPEWLRARMDMIRSVEGWWLNLRPFSLGFDVYKITKELGYEIHMLTKGNLRISNAWKEKVEWTRKHLGASQRITITQEKGLVYGKVLVDDYQKYVTSWLAWRPRGLVIMPASPTNKDFFHPNVIRYDGSNLAIVRMALEQQVNRANGEPLTLDESWQRSGRVYEYGPPPDLDSVEDTSDWPQN